MNCTDTPGPLMSTIPLEAVLYVKMLLEITEVPRFLSIWIRSSQWLSKNVQFVINPYLSVVSVLVNFRRTTPLLLLKVTLVILNEHSFAYMITAILLSVKIVLVMLNEGHQ